MSDQLEALTADMLAVCKKLEANLQDRTGLEPWLRYEIVDQAMDLARAIVGKVEERPQCTPAGVPR